MKHKKIDIAKAKCTRLSFDSAVQFLRATPDTKELTGFDIDAYTGAVVDRWWGKLVVDVAGISASQQMPIFRNHDHNEIVGYSTSTRNDGTFGVQGVFSSATEAAAEVKALAAEGFPWQASIGVRPKTILEIRENASMVVNGQAVHGPAEVWLESEVFETSFVPLGADGNTRVSVFEREQVAPHAGVWIETEYEQQRADAPTTPTQQERKMDLKQLKTEHPELVVALSAEIVAGLQDQELRQHNPGLATTLLAQGAQQERERIADVRSQMLPGHEGLIAQLELDGTSTGADAAKAIVAAEKLARTKAAETFGQGANPPVNHGGDPSGGSAQPTMKREAFNALSPAEQGKTITSGVKIID
jgi:hypothetical protein